MEVMERKVLIVDTDKCTGCMVCELACSMVSYGEYNPEKSYIKILKNKEMDVNVVALRIGCNFCGECVEWCLPEAIKFVDLKEAIINYKGTKVGIAPAPLIS
jgi:carbon-monoxide dehydrogenase iron sulfur subunit